MPTALDPGSPRLFSIISGQTTARCPGRVLTSPDVLVWHHRRLYGKMCGMPITVEVVSGGVDWVPIAAAGATVVAAVGGIWGTAWQAKKAREAATKDLALSISTEDRRARDAAKGRVYAEFLRSISESYAKAVAEGKAKSRHRPLRRPARRDQSDTPEDADLLAATAAIELFANEEISKTARKLSDDVLCVHKGLRGGNLSLIDTKVPDINARRAKPGRAVSKGSWNPSIKAASALPGDRKRSIPGLEVMVALVLGMAEWCRPVRGSGSCPPVGSPRFTARQPATASFATSAPGSVSATRTWTCACGQSR